MGFEFYKMLAKDARRILSAGGSSPLPRHGLYSGRSYPSTSPTRHLYYRRSFTDVLPKSHIEDADVLIVGSGAAALTAAIRVKSHNLKPLIIEKTSLVGGTTCYSGGGLWIPNSGLHPQDITDSFAEALKYMKSTVDKHSVKSSTARKITFLKNGPKMVAFLQEEGFRWQPSRGYPDYYPLVEGGKITGRSIEGKTFDLNKLGDWKRKIRMTTRKPLYPMYTFEAGDMYRAMSGNLRGFLTAAKVVLFRMWAQKALGRLPVTLGMSLVGQLLYLCIGRRIPIMLNTGLKKLIVEDGVVTAAIVVRDGEELVMKAAKGVILAAGGFARNTDMRRRHQMPAGAVAKSLTSPEDKGDAISAAVETGAAVELMDEAWWGPTLVDKTGKPYWTQFERALPHAIIVDKRGDRFLNEAEPYTRLIHNLFAHQKKSGVGVPAFLILDSKHRDKYVLSGMMPGKLQQWALDSGLIVKADTLEDLAQNLGIDMKNLKATVERFNAMAAKGVDEDFDRGVSPYDHFFGDPTYQPNPNMGSLSQPPFYGAKLVPGDLGTKGGILTDEYARALKKDGNVIEGLYAVGNSSATVMGREYIGAGSTLGPGLTFAYVAADHIANGERSKSEVNVEAQALV